MSSFFETKIEYLKGVGPQKATLLNKELGIFNYGQLLQHYPFRYEDKTKIYTISELKKRNAFCTIKRLYYLRKTRRAAKKTTVNRCFQDDTGSVELIWFQGVSWIQKQLQSGVEYLLFGKPAVFNNRLSFSHPEIEVFTALKEGESSLYPVYSSTELLRKRFLDSKAIAKLQKHLLSLAFHSKAIQEILPEEIITNYGFFSKALALAHIHFPADHKHLEKAKFRLKFDELFLIQLQLLLEKGKRKAALPGLIFKEIPLVTEFYKNHLPFDLTEAQKRVVKEIRKDFLAGKQMNRLLQGDVGSGKTIVAFICMLMAVDNSAQACLMAPTEILAEQHYKGLKPYTEALGIRIALLTGSVKKSARKPIHEQLASGELHLIVGTHALIEDKVVFNNLGLCVIDEQTPLWRGTTS